MQELLELHCEKLTSNSTHLDDQEINRLMTVLRGWNKLKLEGVMRLEKEYKFKDFAKAVAFTNKVARAADEEDHHPAILTEWGKVTVTWWTHKVKGLHRNDFIMAAKTDELFGLEPTP
jgi:4a-hydroxytetrahydrobiopterin dehydratase